MDWKGKKVLIVGFGKSGEAALRYLLSQGARPAVTDMQNEKQLSSAMAPFKSDPVDWYLGAHEPEVFLSAEVLVVSPGVPWNLEPLKMAREKQIPVMSELELALPGNRAKIIAVTGTNGKTTTAMLIHHLLKTAGKKSLLAGNVGRPLLDCLEELKASEFLVLEVSSYQLEATPSLKPQVALWLNITEDHLDWHEGFESYVQAKAKLVRQTGLEGKVIYNREDEIVSQSVEQIPCNRIPFSTKHQLKMGGWVEEGRLTLKDSPQKDPISFDLKEVLLKGIHNWENMLAALLAVAPYINDAKMLQKGLSTFTPLPHRMQFVRQLNGVTYINDSKATNVGASLKAFASTQGPIIWIAGGRDKGGSYAPLKGWVKKKSKKIILLGESREKMAEVFKECGVLVMAKDLKEAVALAFKEGQSGDTVLFSPACSSFDSFKNYAERGEKFMTWVREL